MVAGKNVALDLGGKTLTNTNAGKATLTIEKDATATVKNGKVIGGTSLYAIQNNGTAMFEDVTASAGNTGSSMLDNWGTLTINSGTYAGGLNVVKSEEGSTLTINGGKFELNYASSQGYTGVVFNYGNATITGGEFICSAPYVKWAHPQCVATGVVKAIRPPRRLRTVRLLTLPSRIRVQTFFMVLVRLLAITLKYRAELSTSRFPPASSPMGKLR